MASALWSALHGRVDLTHGPASVVDPRWGIEGAVRAIVSGFAAGEPLPSPLTPPDEAPLGAPGNQEND